MLTLFYFGFFPLMCGPNFVPNCSCWTLYDFDNDSDVDLRDFAMYQNGFSCHVAYGCGKHDPNWNPGPQTSSAPVMTFAAGAKKRAFIDFDEVIQASSYDEAIAEKPNRGIKETLQALSSDYEIVIFSLRAYDRPDKGKKSLPNEREQIATWLRGHEIPFDTIYHTVAVPKADLYLTKRNYDRFFRVP